MVAVGWFSSTSARPLLPSFDIMDPDRGEDVFFRVSVFSVFSGSLHVVQPDPARLDHYQTHAGQRRGQWPDVPKSAPLCSSVTERSPRRSTLWPRWAVSRQSHTCDQRGVKRPAESVAVFA